MASSLVKSAAQHLGNLLVEEATALYKVKDRIESLQMELKWMECFLRDADTQQHQEEVVCLWVSQVRDLTYDAEDKIERYLHEVSHHRRDGVWNTLKWFPRILNRDALTLHELASEIDSLMFKMSELNSRLQRYGIKIIKSTSSLEYNTMIMEERRTFSHTEDIVVGLVEDVKQVVHQLVNTDVKVVVISGIGGLGKTTLVRKVFKHKDIKDHFNDNCAWVYLSKEFDRGRIFEQILLQLEKGEEAKNKIKQLKAEQLPGELHKLLREKRCMVVVDDIWTEKAWKSLQPGFESIFTTTSSSKILLTTRDQGLLQHVDPFGYPHILKPLSLDDSWELLKRKAAIGQGSAGGESLPQGQNETKEIKSQDDEDAMEKLGREMLKHCDGLPIAIVALGGILSNKKTISGWEDVKNNISSYLMGGIKQGGGDQIVKVLELSYHDLPFYLKPCFLYLGNFPEDYTISTHRLYHLWEAEGFLVIEGAAKKNGGTIYDVGEMYLNELVQRSMIQVGECWPSGRIKTCRVHDVMRDMCLRKCEEVSFLNYIECSKSDTSSMPSAAEVKRLRRCALNDENGDFIDKNFEHGERAICLRSLLVFQKQKISGKVWKCFPLLRVLDLEGVDLEFVNLDGVGNLIHLRYLNLRKSGVEALPSCLYGLKYLETLDLRCHYGISKLRNKFDKMKKLRHLYLPECFEVEGGEKLKFPIGGQIETIENFDPGTCETTALMQMTNLRVFSITKRFGMMIKKREVIKGVLEAPVMKNEGQLINSFKLRISGDAIEGEPMILRSAARHPCFNGLTVDGDITSAISVVFPESLTRLRWNNSRCAVREGEVSSLEKLRSLKSLTLGPVGKKLSLSEGGFPELTQLSLNGQSELEEWDVGEGALPNLQSLEIFGCEKFNKLNSLPHSLTEVDLYNFKFEGDHLVLALEKLPRLKSLQLCDVAVAGGNRLSFSPSSFPQLTDLELRFLDELEEWEAGVGSLPNLQRLLVSDCKKLNKWKNIPHSLTQVKVSLYGIGDSVVAELERLPCLQTLSIYCPAIRTKLSFSPGSFTPLAQLYLELDDWEWEVGDGALPNLQHLHLENCRKYLSRIPNSLTEVKLLSCNIGEGGVSLLALGNLPRLQQLHLDSPIIGGGGGKKMSFSAGSFPHLTQLQLRFASDLEEWEVGNGALPHLQHLVLYECTKLKRIPDGLPDSIHIECKDPCIKGIEKYNTCPHFKPNRFKLMSCLH